MTDRRPEHQRARGEDDISRASSCSSTPPRSSPDARSPPAASLAFHPDHQEVHLAAADAGDRRVWPGSWRRGRRRRSVRRTTSSRSTDLRLVSGDQQITADGTFGRPGDALQVHAEERRSGQRRRAPAPAAAVHRPARCLGHGRGHRRTRRTSTASSRCETAASGEFKYETLRRHAGLRRTRR